MATVHHWANLGEFPGSSLMVGILEWRLVKPQGNKRLLAAVARWTLDDYI